MRLLLALVALAMFVAVGCETAEQANNAPAKSGGETPAAKPAPADTNPDADADQAAVQADTSNLKEVSLKLPGMT